MDLLFKRYADPFSLLNGYVQTKQFSRFVPEFCKRIAEDDRWAFFLHKVWDQSYADFCAAQQITQNLQNMSEEQITATVKESMNILGNFKPDEKEGEM